MRRYDELMSDEGIPEKVLVCCPREREDAFVCDLLVRRDSDCSSLGS